MARSGGGKLLVVAQDGKGHFSNVQAAIDAVPLRNNERITIDVWPGVYRQPIYVPKTKNNITLRGFCAEDTVLTWNNTATRIEHHQVEEERISSAPKQGKGSFFRVLDLFKRSWGGEKTSPTVRNQAASVIGTGTFGCGTVIVEGEDFIAEGITFENAAPQGSGQAVAIRVTADRCAFYSCRFLGWQDTAYLHYGKHYLRDCYIEGSCDFIFGNATALLEHCHIHCKSQGYITAQSRKSAQESTGYVFLRCVITSNGGSSYMHLGRPWAPFSRVVFAYTWMDACIKPDGWNNWNNPENERSACFYEYRCSGPGSNPCKRVSWARQLMDDEAAQFISQSFIDPDQQKPWLMNNMSVKIPLSAYS